MKHIEKNLMHGEAIFWLTCPHWIVFVPVLLWYVFCFCIVMVAYHLSGMDWLHLDFRISEIVVFFAVFLTLHALIRVFNAGVHYLGTEYAITNRRVVEKTGFFDYSEKDILLNRIEGVLVFQTVVGKMLGFGTVVVNGVGGGYDVFEQICNPVEFAKCTEEHVYSCAGVGQ
jgi:hypothetical protein